MGRPNLEYYPEVIREFASVFLVSRDPAWELPENVKEFVMNWVALVFVILLWLPIATWAAQQEEVEISITGLACPFCAYGLEKNLKKLPEVSTVTVNLADSMAHIVMITDHEADLEAIKKAIVKAGFTPGDSITTLVHL